MRRSPSQLVVCLVCLMMTLASALSGDASAGKQGDSDALFNQGYRFVGINGDPAKDDPKEMEFQINQANGLRRAEFLKLGATLPRTRFKITKYTFLTRLGPAGELQDVSELTLTHQDTGATALLKMGAK